MNTLLSIANGALQYRRGKQTGLAGLAGIGLALLCVYQWDHILPVLNALGIVAFFDRIGLIYEGDAGLTGFAIFMFIFRLTIVYCAALLVLLMFGIAVSMFFSSDTVFKYIIIPLMMVIGFPIAIVYYTFLVLFKRQELIEKGERMKLVPTPQAELLIEHSEEISRTQAIYSLNRIPTFGDHLSVLGETEDKRLFLLLPRPLSFEDGKHISGDLEAVEFSVEKYIEKFHKPKSMFDRIPKHFLINLVSNEREVMSESQFVSFYQTNSEDMLYEIQACKNLYGFKKYVKEVQDIYFNSKEAVLSRIKQAEDKETFDNLVKRMTVYNAPNEDIVKMMRDSENEITI